jgi:hypothetical protein
MTNSGARILYWSGLALYLISFFLFSVVNRGFLEGVRGYWCAIDSVEFGSSFLVDRIQNPHRTLVVLSLTQGISLFASGVINPAFALYVLTFTFRPQTKSVRFLRFFVVALLPFCWIFFISSWSEFMLREGYFVWTLGIVMVLFSTSRLPTLVPQ